MPSIDEGAKAFELELAGRVGAAVQARRKALKMTAVQLSDRTREIGYPITRGTIAKIESNSRAGKLDVTELLALSIALDTPPALLLFPDYPDGEVEVAPGRQADSQLAIDWLAGNAPLGTESNEGTKLIDVVLRSKTIHHDLLHMERMSQESEASEGWQQVIADKRRQLDAVQHEISQARVELWNTERDKVNAFLWSPTPDDDD
jgi:transcriptional regulator with XRE-family HTH domain